MFGFLAAHLPPTVAIVLGPVLLCLWEREVPGLGRLPRITHTQQAGPKARYITAGLGWDLNLCLPPHSGRSP